MRAIEEHDAGFALVGGGDFFSRFADGLLVRRRDVWRRGIGVNEDFLKIAFAVALGDGIDFEALEVEWRRKLFHFD
jgi:hypothetical protein